jgi:hypothetical protein
MKTSTAMYVAFVALMAHPQVANAMSPGDKAKLHLYSIILGRGPACASDVTNAQTHLASEKVGAWVERVSPRAEHLLSITYFMKTLDTAFHEQKSDKSSLSCSVVGQQFRTFPWP